MMLFALPSRLPSPATSFLNLSRLHFLCSLPNSSSKSRKPRISLETKEVSLTGLCVSQSERHSRRHPGVNGRFSSLPAGLRCPQFWHRDPGGCCRGGRWGLLCTRHANFWTRRLMQGEKMQDHRCSVAPNFFSKGSAPFRERTSNHLQVPYAEGKIKESQLAAHRGTTERERKEECFAMSKVGGGFVLFTCQGLISGSPVKAHVEMGLHMGPRIPPNPDFCLKSAHNCFSIFLLGF